MVYCVMALSNLRNNIRVMDVEHTCGASGQIKDLRDSHFHTI